MFNKLLKGLKGKPALPEVEVIGYEYGAVSFKSVKPLAIGLCEAVGHLPGGRVEPIHLLIESYLEDQQIYWAELVNKELEEVLLELFPPPPPEEEIHIDEPQWTEKRQFERMHTILGVMSPVVPGFKCLTHDLTAEGVRLVTDTQLDVGKVIKFRLELDDSRIPALDLLGQVVWSAPRLPKGFWSGLLYHELQPQQKETLSKYLDKMRHMEVGVFNKQYADG